jgi:hypothetical protein
MPSAWAAICAETASEPWPVSTVPVSKVAVPSSFTFTTAALGLAATVKPIGYHMQAMPRPRRFTTLLPCAHCPVAEPKSAAMSRSDSFTTTLWSTWPVGLMEPSSNALRSRMASGSMPSALAMSSMCDS